MNLVSGLSRHPVTHHHDDHRSSVHTAGRFDEKRGAPSCVASWLINHTDTSPTEYSHAPGYSSDFHGNGGRGSIYSLDPPHPQLLGAGALVTGAGEISVSAVRIGIHDTSQHTQFRSVKRRPTANRKERRRTQSINSAFAELRECIPNVPGDTKLSKIKTLRLATSYISYLMDVLENDGHQGQTQAFKAELKETEVREESKREDAVRTPKYSKMAHGVSLLQIFKEVFNPVGVVRKPGLFKVNQV